MSQPVSDHQTVLDSEQSEASALPELRFDLSEDITPLTLENNADSLMDVLFADVDRMLERGVVLPSESPAEEQPTSPPVIPLDTILPPKLAPRDLIPQLVDAEPESQPETTSKQPQAAKAGKNPLWLAVLCGSLLLSTGILCFLFRDQLTQAWLQVLGRSDDLTSATVTASTDPKAKEDSDFLKYIGRSIDRLARLKTDAEQVAQNVPASPSPSPVERVYIPVPTAQNSTTPTGNPVINPSVNPAPATNRPVANPVPVAASPLPAVAPATVPNIAAAATHTLIGVLELGDKSAALFEVNGTPQRIEIGQQVGTSGWMLVSINNQEAIVRRNGEVRSIYVGQKF